MNKINLNNLKSAYLIGIKGAAMVAVAEILKNRGVMVSGSDTEEKFFTDEILKKLKVKYFEGFSVDNIPHECDIVIYSTAYNEENNEEIAFSKRENKIVLSYPEFLGLLFEEKMSVAVCGTHGKTTTTAILAQILKTAELDPSAIVGSRVKEWPGNALAGVGQYFVAEADEYQNKFEYYNPTNIILTSCDYDHPDFFPDFSDYKEVFKNFVAKLKKTGFLVVYGDSVDTLEIVKYADCEIFRYGFLAENDYLIKNVNYKNNNQTQVFEVFYGDKKLDRFEIQLPGKHNILNATAAIAASHRLNISLSAIKKALKNFQGTTRRFEYKGQYKKAILIDDYAHHPEEIKATLKAVREIYPAKNIITVFHPHTFSRTEALLEEFAQSFDDSNLVIIIDVYSSAREERGAIDSEDLVKLINRYFPGKADHIATIPEAIKFLSQKATANDVIISMGAGDVWKVTEELSKNK